MFRKVYLDVKKQMIEECSKNICPQENVQEAVKKLCKPALLISFCYYPIQQIFKEWRKEKSMLPDVDFEVVFQMCWDAIKR